MLDNKQAENNLIKLNRKLIFIMSAASGITVANIYYIQPLLEQISCYFAVSKASVGFVATLTQAGYALGLFLILPLADIKESEV